MDIKTVLTDAIIKTAKNAIAAGVVKDGTLPEVQLTVPPKKENGSTEKEVQFHRKHGMLIESGIGEGAFSQAVSEHREILVYVTYVYVVTAGLIPPAALRHVGIILPQKTKLQLSTKVHFSLSNKEQFFLFNKFRDNQG